MVHFKENCTLDDELQSFYASHYSIMQMVISNVNALKTMILKKYHISFTSEFFLKTLKIELFLYIWISF